MAADTKSIKNRMKSIYSTLHVTKAMELVASSKIRKADDIAKGAVDYANAMTDAMKDILSPESKRSLYLSPPKTGIACIIAVAGDRGLAGGYNSNVFKLLREETEGRNSLVLPIGNRIVEYCIRHKYKLISSEFRSSEHISDSDIKRISNRLAEMYNAHAFDSIKIISTKPVNVLSQVPACVSILPLGVPERNHTQIVFEPDCMTVLDMVITDYLTAMICASVRESFLAELYARRNSMDSATKNAGEMIEKLSLQYNRARQSSITQEITEIVAGAENQ